MRRYTEEEIKFIKKHTGSKTVKAIAVHLDRSYPSVFKKIQQLHLDTGYAWSDEDVHYLINHYEKETLEEIANHLKRNKGSVRAKIKRLGLVATDIAQVRKRKEKHFYPWTNKEEELLRSLAESRTFTYPDIAEKLNRSERSIQSKLRRLKLPTPMPLDRHNFYTTEDEKELEKLYKEGNTLEEIGFRMNRSARAVKGKLIRMGYDTSRRFWEVRK